MSYAVYIYSDADRNQEHIGSNELSWSGTWSSSGSYYAGSYDAVLYGDTRYVAIIDNVGVNPLARLPNRQMNPFSALIVTQPGDEPPFAPPQAPDAVYAALQTAWAGTELAYTALQTAWNGTALAQSAYDLASSLVRQQTANPSWR